MSSNVTVDLRNDFNPDLYKKEYQWQEGEFTVTRNTQWSGPGCHQGCGVLFYTKDGKLDHIEGDLNSTVQQGRLCMRCLALMESVYHKDRQTHPLRRVGERGENKWERISWDEAYDEIEKNVRRIWAEGNPKSIVSLFGTGRNATWQLPVLSLAGFKSPNIGGGFLSGDSCYAPRLMAMNTLLGGAFIADCSQLHSGRYDDPRWVTPEYIVLWGHNAVASNADGFYGHWVVDCMKRGSKIISIDPRVTWLAGRSDQLLRLRPGTDAALAMGILNVLISENLYNQEFVDNWCFGFDELKEAVKDMTPERAAEICWLKSEQIIKLARTLGTANPWAMQWGLPVDQAKHGTAIAQAIVSIMAITGQIDNPGGNVLVDTGYVMGDIRMAMSHRVPPEITEGRFGNEYDIRKYGFVNQHFTDMVLKAIETGEPYPVKMLYICSTNTFANMSAEAKRVYDAMKTVPFIVCCDLWLTPTAVACADIFLPVAMSAERDGLRAWWNPLRAITKVVDTPEAKGDEEIALDLIKRLSPEDAPWDTTIDLLNYVMHDMQSASFEGTFEELAQKVEHYTDVEYNKYASGKIRANGTPGFNTPTGRIELWSTSFDDYDLPQTPYWSEPTESPVSTPELAKEYPFVLSTGQRCFEFFHSEHRQVETMREFHPDPISEMNSDDAAALGLHDGDWIILENPHGKAKLRLRTNTGMRKGVVNAEHGWWFPEREGAEPTLYGVFESNANCLTTQFDFGPTTYGAPYKNQICKVYKAD